MQRRKLLAAIGSVAAGGAVTVGTGAFSSTAVDRNVTVDVQNDANAYLGLRPTNDPNSQFANQNNDGELEVAFADSGNGGTGVPQNALTVFDNVFQVENQGTQRVQVTLSDGGGSDETLVVESPGDIGDGTAPDGGGTITKGSDDIAVALASNTPDDDSDGNVELDPGENVKVDFAVATGSGADFPNVNSLTIDADDADDN